MPKGAIQTRTIRAGYSKKWRQKRPRREKTIPEKIEELKMGQVGKEPQKGRSKGFNWPMQIHVPKPNIPKISSLPKPNINMEPDRSTLASKIRNTIEDFEPSYNLNTSDKKLAKGYVKLCERTYAKLQKKIPSIWQALMGRRWILPQYRQEDYFSQQACDFLMLDFINEFTQRGDDHKIDEILNTQFIGVCRALECNRPTFYLEKEICDDLMKTKLNPTLTLDLLDWRFPSFRVYLPKGFLTIRRKDEDCSIMFLDIVRGEKDVPYSLPIPIIKELHNLWGDYKQRPLSSDKTRLGVSGNLDFDCCEGAIAYAAITPIPNVTLQYVFSREEFVHIKGRLESDAVDDVFTIKMLEVAIRILFLLSCYEIVPDPEPSDILRQPSMKGDRQLSGLYRAKFVGESVTKITESRARARGIVEPTGITHAPHWVSGHPQRICWGPKHAYRKWVWIKAYRTGKDQDQDATPAAGSPTKP